MNTEYFICDGRNVGFKVFTKDSCYLKTKNGADRIFNSVDFAKAIAFINGCRSADDFELHLYVYGNVIPFKYLQRINDNIEFFGDNDGELTRYVIEETKVREYNNFGYICFDNGDVERTDKKDGIKRGKLLKKIIAESIENLNEQTLMVSNILEYDKGIMLKFYHTTATLDIVTNSGLMDINQWRREVESEDPAYSRCFPFIKGMDKFVTFYTFISKEVYEPKSDTSNAMHPKMFRDMLIKDLVDNWDKYNRDNKWKEVVPKFHSVFYKNANQILS